MKTFLSILLCILVAVYPSQQQADSPTYRAGVLEYAPHDGLIEDITKTNLQNYLNIIQDVEKESLDILVFPEATLNRDWAGTTPKNASIYVPSESEKIKPCDHGDMYSEILREISCAAATNKLYIVINVAELANCNETALQNCTDTETVMFNTNVVFDRNGTIISRYRKIHLFGETGFSESDDKKLGVFETDFNVTFGHFICFDLMFQEPTMQLIDMNIKNIIFPTMWFSELSSLTAVEIQQSFAYTHNVNLLASGANNPHIGSTGSGIFSGKSGAIKSVMSGKKLTEVLISDVPKIPGIENMPHFNDVNEKVDTDPTEMDTLFLKSQELKYHKTQKIDTMKEHQIIELMEDGVKCDIEVSLNTDYTSNATGSDHYSYRAILFNGVRSFVFKTGGVIECIVVACTSENDRETCSHRFTSYPDIKPTVEFTKIKINAIVPKPVFNETMKAHNLAYYPVTLLTNIYPFDKNEFEYSITDSDDSENYEIEMSMNSPQSELLTFGIFGRNFDRDFHPPTGAGNVINTLTHLIAGLLIMMMLINTHIVTV